MSNVVELPTRQKKLTTEEKQIIQIIKWDARFLDLAKEVSTWSRDPSTRVGAIIVGDSNTVLGMGYNGAPRWADDDEIDLENREEKYKWTIHAEMNAIMDAMAKHGDISNSQIYTYPFHPCSHCAKHIIQAGIVRVVTTDFIPERWADDFEVAGELFDATDVVVQTYAELRRDKDGSNEDTDERSDEEQRPGEAGLRGVSEPEGSAYVLGVHEPEEEDE